MDDGLVVTLRPPDSDREVDIRDSVFAEQFRIALTQNGAPIAQSDLVTARAGGTRVVEIQQVELTAVAAAARSVEDIPNVPTNWFLISDLDRDHRIVNQSEMTAEEYAVTAATLIAAGYEIDVSDYYDRPEMATVRFKKP